MSRNMGGKMRKKSKKDKQKFRKINKGQWK